MKGLVWLLAALLLSGCAKPPEPLPPETTVAQTVPVETTLPTETAPAQPEPEKGDLVLVKDWLPSIQTDLRYAAADNFTGQRIYGFQDAYLRYGTVKKLAAAARELEERGYILVIWDAFRPVSAQFALWEAYPDGNFVADPNRTHSAHSRGNTLDVTLADRQGNLLEMPTAFDDFSALADRDYSDCSEAARENALLLEEVMTGQGFSGYQKEWWHFTDADTYPVEEQFTPLAPAISRAAEDGPMNLCRQPGGEVLAEVMPGDELLVLAGCGDLYLVRYGFLAGYLPKDQVLPLQAYK